MKKPFLTTEVEIIYFDKVEVLEASAYDVLGDDPYTNVGW